MFKKVFLSLYTIILFAVTGIACPFENGTDNFGFTNINYSEKYAYLETNLNQKRDVIPVNLPLTFLFKFIVNDPGVDPVMLSDNTNNIALIYSVVKKNGDSIGSLTNNFYLIPNAKRTVTKLLPNTPITIFGNFILQGAEIKSKFKKLDFQPGDLIVVVCVANIGLTDTTSLVNSESLTTTGPILKKNNETPLKVSDIISGITKTEDGFEYEVKSNTTPLNVLVLKYEGAKFIGR
jgi:hypothetical protein